MQFQKYTHLERIEKEECDGILNGTCYIQSKIDGTNASVYMRNGELKAGSRTRELTLDNDNQGFYKFILTNAVPFLSLFNLFPNAVLYGEFLCPNVIKSYRPDAWRKFYAFDMALVKGDELEYLRPQQYEPVLETLGIPFVPTIAIVQDYNGDFSEFAQSARFLLDESIADAHPEGIVIKNFDFRNKYGRNTFAKIVYASFKETKKTQVALTSTVEKDIAEKYATEHLVRKELAKLVNDGVTEGIQGKLLQVVFKTLVQEEMFDILKKFKNPIIDFKRLQSETITQTKLYAKEYF